MGEGLKGELLSQLIPQMCTKVVCMGDSIISEIGHHQESSLNETSLNAYICHI